MGVLSFSNVIEEVEKGAGDLRLPVSLLCHCSVTLA